MQEKIKLPLLQVSACSKRKRVVSTWPFDKIHNQVPKHPPFHYKGGSVLSPGWNESKSITKWEEKKVYKPGQTLQKGKGKGRFHIKFVR